jgi:amidase
MPFFGQEHLVAAQGKPGLDAKAYREALANNRRYSREEGIDKILKEQSSTRWWRRPAAWPG